MQLVEAVKNLLRDIMSFFNPEELTLFFRWLFLNESPAVRELISREGSSVDATPIPPAIETAVSRLQVAKNEPSLSCLFCFGETCALDAEPEEKGDMDCEVPATIPMPKATFCAESPSEQLTFDAVTETDYSKDYAIVVVGNATIEDAAEQDVGSTKASVCSDILPPKFDANSDTGSCKERDVPAIESTQCPSDNDTDHRISSTASGTPPKEVTDHDVTSAATRVIESPQQQPENDIDHDVSSTASGVIETPQCPPKEETDHNVTSAATGVIESPQQQPENDNDYDLSSAAAGSSQQQPENDKDHDVSSAAAEVTENPQSPSKELVKTDRDVSSTASGVIESPQHQPENDNDRDSTAASGVIESPPKEKTVHDISSPQCQSENDNDRDISSAASGVIESPSKDSANGISNAASGVPFDKASPCTDVPSLELNADTASKTDLKQECSAKCAQDATSKVPGAKVPTTTHSKKKKKKRGAKKAHATKVATDNVRQGSGTTKKGTSGSTPVSTYTGQQNNATGISKEDMCPLYEICPQLAPGAKVKMHPSSIKPSQVQGKVTFNSPLFNEKDFNFRVSQEKVCLEFVQLDTNEPKIHGYIRVLNTNYDKDVMVVYIVEKENNWKIVCSSQAEWVETVEDGTMDRFSFTIPGIESVGKVSLIIKFNGEVDDNHSEKYSVVYDRV